MSLRIEQIKYIKYYTMETDDFYRNSFLKTLFSNVNFKNDNNYNKIND